MNATCRIQQPDMLPPALSRWLLAFLTAMLLAMLAPLQAFAATPLAGTSIGNQAAASYTDASLTPRVVTSNTVSTIVQQVASFTLAATQTKSASPGGTVYFPHTLTNTGNGTDTFTLATANNAGGTFDFSTIALYVDANGDGVPDNATPILSTGALAAGGIFRFVAAATVPGAATNGNTDSLNVTAVGTATAVPAPLQTNVDTANVSGNAVINVTKAISAGSGASPSGPHTYTLTYTNTGNSTATALTLLDAIPVGMTYVPNSGRWSVTGATVLTDADTLAQGTSPTIVYDFGVTLANRVTAVISSIPAGTSGTVTFQVNVNSNVAPSNLNNTATYTYNDGVAPVASQNTNTVGFTVNQTASLTMTTTTVASATQGATVSFTNVVTNTGNGTDSFDITIGTSAFPVGTTFQLFKSDGSTPLVDTNGNSTPDTGPMLPGAVYNVILKASLPTGASGGGAYTVPKTATSKFNPAIFTTTIDTLTTISASTVDLTNNSARTDSTPAGTAILGNAATTGFGATTTTVITTNTTNPGTTTRFNLFVNNTSLVADNYNLTAAGLPVGWSVVFRDSTSTGIGNGAIITNTGTINAGFNTAVYADVTVAANAAPGTTNIDFTVTSPTTGATDVKRDAVSVNTINNVTLTPNNTGQVFPGGSVVYSHTLTNNGNVSQNITFAAGFLTDSQVAAGWTSVLYTDNGGTVGALDATDSAVTTTTNFALAAGASQTLFVKVFAPGSAAISTSDITTVTVTYPTGTAVATDTTTVIGGQVTLTKLQALDAACDGTADTAFGVANITTGAIPGACIRYQITATNVGTTNVTGLVVSDGTPSSTTYNVGSTPNPAAVTGVGNTITAPIVNTAGTIQATIPTLTPSASSVITFGVRIDP